MDTHPVIETPDGDTFDEEEDITLVCKTSMFDFELLTWERGSALTLPPHSVSTTKSGEMVISTLTVRRARLEDAGVYVCKGWSESSNGHQKVNVSVKGIFT